MLLCGGGAGGSRRGGGVREPGGGEGAWEGRRKKPKEGQSREKGRRNRFLLIPLRFIRRFDVFSALVNFPGGPNQPPALFRSLTLPTVHLRGTSENSQHLKASSTEDFCRGSARGRPTHVQIRRGPRTSCGRFFQDVSEAGR